MATLSKVAAAKNPLKPIKKLVREDRVLSCGMKAIVCRRGPLPMVAIRWVSQAGSATDPKGKHGLAELTARLLRRGTLKRSADALNDSIEHLGATFTASVQDDYLSLALVTPSEHLRPMLEAVAEMVRQPAFAPEEVDAAKARLLGILANDRDDPSALADRAFLRAFFADHPYGHDTTGHVADVKGLTRDDVLAFHRERLGPAVSILSVVGELDPEKTFAAAEQAFQGWSGGPSAPTLPPACDRPVQEGKVVIVDKPDQTQVQVRFGMGGTRKNHPDYFPITAVNGVLGGSFTSRLMQEIRVKRGLSYGASSRFDNLRTCGSFQISSFTKTETVGELLKVATGEVAKMRQKGPTPAELQKTLRFVAALYPMRFETNEAVAMSFIEMEIYGLAPDYVEKYRDRLTAVTSKQALAAARKYLALSGHVIVLVGDAKALVPQVERYGEVVVQQVSDLE